MANYVLEILDGDRAGDVLSVGDAPLRVGRKPGNDLVLADEKTSGVHCEIAPEGDRLVLKDLGSTNGTFLDGKRVTEVVLTPGDVFTVGRLRVQFREEGAAASAAGEDEQFSIRKLDAARLQRRGSPVGLLLILALVLGGGGGGWWWMQQGQQASPGAARGPSRRAALVVPGNRLDADVGACEAEEGWRPKAGGLGWRLGGGAHTGESGFRAQRDAESGEAATADDFAVLALDAPLEVFAGRTLTIAAHCRTTGAGAVGVRAVAFAQSEAAPFRFVSGTAIEPREGWQRLEAVVTVPDGCDRLQLEVVAALPDDASEAIVDDVAVTEGGDKNDLKVKLESGPTAVGFGAALAVRSSDPQNPATVLGLAPGRVPDALRGLLAAGQCVLSDVGASVAVTSEESGFALAVEGCEAVTLVLPLDSGEGLMTAGADGAFASTSAAAEFRAARVLFGSFGTRAAAVFAAPTPVRGQVRGGAYDLVCEASELQLRVGFRAERMQAAELVRAAAAALDEGRPGVALDQLDRVFGEWPMDSRELANAQQLRQRILGEQAAAARQLEQDFEEAGFFDTRGGYERVLEGVDVLISLYGEKHVEGLAAQRDLRARAAARLATFDRKTFQAQRDRLALLADAFAAASEPGLEAMVQQYIQRHLPKSDDPDGGDPDGGDPDGGDPEGGRD